VPLASQIIDRIEPYVREQLGDLHRLLARLRRKP
jgi:hypothetical protein